MWKIMKDDILNDLARLTPDDYEKTKKYWQFISKESPNNIRDMREESKHKGESHLFYLAEQYRAYETNGIPGLPTGMSVNHPMCRNAMHFMGSGSDKPLQIRPVDGDGNLLDPLKFGKPPAPGTCTDWTEPETKDTEYLFNQMQDAMDRIRHPTIEGSMTGDLADKRKRMTGTEIGLYIENKQYKAQLVIIQDILPDASIEIPEDVEAADSVLEALRTSMRLKIIENMDKFVDDVIGYIKCGGEIGDNDEDE